MLFNSLYLQVPQCRAQEHRGPPAPSPHRRAAAAAPHAVPQQVSFLNEAAAQAKTARANVSDSDGGGGGGGGAAAADASAAPRIDPAHLQAALMGNRELQRLIVTMTSGGSGEQLLQSIRNVHIDCLSTQRA